MLPFNFEKTKTRDIYGVTFPIYNCLKVGEQLVVDSCAELPNTYTEVCKLAILINEELQLNDILFAFDIISNPNWEQEQNKPSKEKIKIFKEARIKYAPDILGLNQLTEKSQAERKNRIVTSVIQFRCDKAWSFEQTSELPMVVFDAIWDFAQEEMGVISQNEAPNLDDLGKPSVINESDLTGSNSTGDSKATTPMTVDSPANDSLTS